MTDTQDRTEEQFPDEVREGAEKQPREAFRREVHSALGNAISATGHLWSIQRALEIREAGGNVPWGTIEDDLWRAAESLSFAHTHVHDDDGAVEQWRRLEADPDDGPEQVDESLRERPPMQVLKDIQKLAEDPDSSMEPTDIATLASNVNDREAMERAIGVSEDHD